MFYVYIIVEESTREVYAGFTSNLDRRIEEHNRGKGARFTKNGKWRLGYYEAFSDESEARVREKKVKHDGRARYQLYRRIEKSLFGHK